MKKPTTISITTQKGGVGKTSTVCAIASVFANNGYKVGVIDVDSQSNSTYLLGKPPYQKHQTIEAILDPNFEQPVSTLFATSKVHRNVQVLPSRIDAAIAWGRLQGSQEFGGNLGGILQIQLQRDKATIGKMFDLLLIDSPPDIDIPMINGLSAADYAIVPMKSGDRFSLDGWASLKRTIQGVSRYTNPELQVMGILITMHDPRFNVCRENFEAIHDKFGKEKVYVFDTYISNSVEVMTTQAKGKPIVVGSPKHKVSLQYSALTSEITKILG